MGFIGGIIPILIAVFIIIYLCKGKSNLLGEDKKAIKEFLCTKDEVEEYDLEYCPDINDFYNRGIIPYFDTGYGNLFIKYNYKNFDCFSSNILLSLKQNENLEDGLYRDIFKGQIYGIFKNLSIENPIRITSNERIDFFNNVKKDLEYKKVETESISLTDNFNIYAKNEIDAFSYLTPIKIELLNELYKKYSFLNIEISKDSIFIAIKSNKHLLDNKDNLDTDYKTILEILNKITTL